VDIWVKLRKLAAKIQNFMINFKKYDSENPQVWQGFRRLALQAKQKGFKHYSANGIFEVMRWQTGISGNDEFKISNNYRPDYARKMMRLYPQFEGFFRVKELKAPRA
tara:strand:- start:1434 stop:1754 length:321 start_codon:yes stop_codon:yes gene_type:complete